jgi:hypothetical protein
MSDKAIESICVASVLIATILFMYLIFKDDR